MVLSDKKGIPLSAVLIEANRHKSQLVEETLGKIRIERSHPSLGI